MMDLTKRSGMMQESASEIKKIEKALQKKMPDMRFKIVKDNTGGYYPEWNVEYKGYRSDIPIVILEEEDGYRLVLQRANQHSGLNYRDVIFKITDYFGRFESLNPMYSKSIDGRRLSALVERLAKFTGE